MEAWDRFRHPIEVEASFVDPEIATRVSRGKAMPVSDYLGYLEQRRFMQIEFHPYFPARRNPAADIAGHGQAHRW